MELRLSLAPGGDLRLHVSDRRSLDIPATEAGLAYILKLLREQPRNAENPPRGYIGAFPTQAVVNRLASHFRAQHAEREREALTEKLGIDIAALEFKL